MNGLLIPGILLALLFNFVNGRNGAANSVSTVVGTHTLSPLRAVTIAAAGNFLGPFLFTTAIARTLGEGILHPADLTLRILVVAILSATGLVILATFSGLPISSTHALVGGLIGSGLASYGAGILILPTFSVLLVLAATIGLGVGGGILLFVPLGRWAEISFSTRIIAGSLFGASVMVPAAMIASLLPLSGLAAILVFIVVSPTLGFFGAFFFDLAIFYLFRRVRQTTRRQIFKPLQVAGSIFQALSHGAHDGQHAAGIITALLLTEGLLLEFAVPAWVTLASALAIALGTLFGGWNVIRRLATQITRLRPYQGFAAAGTAGILLASLTTAGVPVSSTHAISGAIVGVGATRGRKAVQWDVVRSVITGWLITIPLAIAVSWGLSVAAGFLA